MTPADLDASSAVALSWLLTYAIHSTILLGAAAAIAARFADAHAWLDLIWKTALLGPLVTASVQVGSSVIPLGGRWPIGTAAQMAAPPVATTPAMPLAPRVETPVTPEKTVTLPSSPAFDRGGETVQPALSDSPDVGVEGPALSDSSDVGVEGPASPAATSASAWHRLARSWPSVAVLSWLVFAAAALVRFAARLFRVHRALGSGPPVSAPHLCQTVEALCDAARERSPIRLTTSSDVCGPPCACRSTDRAAGAVSAAARRRAATGCAGARDRACGPARSGVAHPGWGARARLLLPAAEPRRPRRGSATQPSFCPTSGRCSRRARPWPWPAASRLWPPGPRRQATGWSLGSARWPAVIPRWFAA